MINKGCARPEVTNQLMSPVHFDARVRPYTDLMPNINATMVDTFLPSG